ncbi:MAG: 2-oxoacid:ferredoxin oxidoreductase subunit beta [Gemmatimonadales bacterium]
MTTTIPQPLKPKDFASDQEVRWCPGCGDYAILKAIQKTLAELEVAPERTVFVSGIGCSSRFPYYMSTYGFHTIHGRAPGIATGLKLANPDLDVWVITGDGDGLSIGGNHLLHVLRRNVDLQIVLFNNEIYGLTKGQVSPTSRIGTKSPTSPRGSIAHPLSPVAVALGAGARFVARAIDIDQKHLIEVLTAAHAHRGASFVEIFQNCPVYNDDVFHDFTDRADAPDTQLHVVHGQPLRYGKDGNRGIRLKPGALDIEAVVIGQDGITEDDILIHDQTNKTLAGLLGTLKPPEFPQVLGLLYNDPIDSYEMQVAALGAARNDVSLNDLIRKTKTWTVG